MNSHDDGSMEFAYRGAMGKLSSQHFLGAMAVAGLIMVVGMVLRQSDMRTDVAVMRREHQMLVTSQSAILEELKTMTYFLSLPPTERPPVTMPPHLHNRLRNYPEIGPQ